jgi:hypothetical protein
MRGVAMEISGDGAMAGGVVSAIVLWLAKLLIGRTLGQVTAELALLRKEVGTLNKEVAFIRGRMRRRGDDDDRTEPCE